jgi:hypothetical protein
MKTILNYSYLFCDRWQLLPKPPKTQSAIKKVATCYDQWYAVFKERGASACC